MPGDEIYFKGWRISKLSFDAAKGEVNMTAYKDRNKTPTSFRNAEYYSYEDKIDFIYGLEFFLTQISKLSDEHNPVTLRDDIKEFLREHNFLFSM